MQRSTRLSLIVAFATGLLLGVSAGGPAGLSASERVEAIDIGEAAARIQDRTGHPSVVLLYATTCSLSRRLFPAFVSLAIHYQSRGVDFLVFSTDKEENSGQIPSFLAQHGAHFLPVFIRPWAPGSLNRALAPLGIRVGSTWTRPLVAVRDREGRVVMQGQGVTDIGPVQNALARIAR